MFRVGQLVMLIVPGEFTTMSGRRIRYVLVWLTWGMRDILTASSSEAVRAELISSGVIDNSAYVVLAGPANTYAHYVATPEEYTVQRYEGASTIFGPRMSFSRDDPQTGSGTDTSDRTDTLDAYINKYTSLVKYLNPSTSGAPLSDPAPLDLTGEAISLQVRSSNLYSVCSNRLICYEM